MNGNVLAPLFLQLCISSSSYLINIGAVCTPDMISCEDYSIISMYTQLPPLAPLDKNLCHDTP